MSSVTRIWVLALNTYREAVRDKLLYNLLLFAALQRHLNYPLAPRPKPVDESRHVIPTLLRRVERLETRLKLLEEEQKGGIDLSKFYGQLPALGDDEQE